MDLMTERHHIPPALRSLLPELPPGVDPLTYRFDQVTHQLERGAIFPVFSMPLPADPNVPQMSGGELIGVRVHENLHRFEVEVEPPRAGRGYRPVNQVGEHVAQVDVTWNPVPDDYVARPDAPPPPTPFDPTRSQRFVMSDGRFVFKDREYSGFRGFATGRTFPSLVGGKPQVRLGAVVDVLEGFGRFAGLPGTVVVDGFVAPPAFMALCITPLLADFEGRLTTRTPLPRILPFPDPDPDALFLYFIARGDPGTSMRLVSSPDGRMLAFSSRVDMRLLHAEIAVGGPKGVRCREQEGQVAATSEARFFMGPLAAGYPVPFQSRGGVLTFFDHDHRAVGTLHADLEEGRAFLLDVPGAPMPVLRGGGIAPIDRGSGLLQDAVGLVVINGFFSLYPRTMYVVYLVRLSDPGRRIREALQRSWT